MPSVNNCQNQTTRCPHVIQIGDSFKQVLNDRVKKFEYTQNLKAASLSVPSTNISNQLSDQEIESKSITCFNHNECEEKYERLMCNDCTCFKNLWMCLREDCYYIGCGQDANSNKHSSTHASRLHHPLSINLNTKNVWCEFCSIRVNLESNIPSLDAKYSPNQVEYCNKNKQNEHIVLDDYELIKYLDTDNNFSNSINEKEDDERSLSYQYGQLGLDNLGNTCYMNAALQALSNCYVFTSFFLECPTYVQQTANFNKTLYQTTNRNFLLSIQYMKLMNDLWQSPQRMNTKKNKIESITYLTPSEFVSTVKQINPIFRGYQQNDSQEFLIYLMDQLHEELKRPILIDELPKEEKQDTDDEDSVLKSSDKDSGVSSIGNGKMVQSIHDERDTESIDSYVTCGDDQTSDLSDNLDFSDADECNTQNRSNCKILNIKEPSAKTKQKPTFTSIITETFEGKIMSQVQCLECNNISTTTESFLHLSIPIPSREYLQMLHNRMMNRDAEINSQSSGWFGWLFDFMKGYIWSNTICLSDCLTAFFSDDDLKGDNMYSCEKCKKLTNGVKYSKILSLPEVLIIHLKRFRHDSMFSAGKIGSYISFPLDNLNMQPFVNKQCKNEITQYDLCSLICHHGGSEGGHYTSYARNHFNEEWYEYDDSYCRQVDSLNVQNAQAYVLFYKKKNIKTDGIKDQLRLYFKSQSDNNFPESILRPYFISKQWLHKLKYFGETGAIDNSDFLCKHNFVNPKYWKTIEELTIPCSEEIWTFLIENFSLKYERNSFCFKNYTNNLYPCKKCQLDEEAIKQRQVYEREELLRLKDKWNEEELSGSPQSRVYAISKTWFKEWEKFVQLNEHPLEYHIPGEINNLPICIPLKQKDKTKIKQYQLNPKISNFKLSEDIWRFLLNIYGGGPELCVSGGQKSNTKEKSLNGKSNL